MAGILKEGPLRKALRGRRLLGEERPTFEGGVTGAIAGEKKAIDDYADLENELRRVGLHGEANIVKEIRNDELDHRVKFELMLERMQIHH